MSKAGLVLALLVIVGCGGNGNNSSSNNSSSNNSSSNNGHSNNGHSNNGHSNNGATNNGATNNGATNNGATNNGATNNGATNNGATNDGEPAAEAQPCRVDTDYDQDGTLDASRSYTIEEGLVVRRTIDDDADGTPNSVTDYTYDAQRRLVTETSDYDNDGVVNFVDTWTYDARGRVVIYERDENMGAGFTHTTEWTDPIHVVTVDFGRDGVVDAIERYTRDGDGNVVLEEADRDADDAFDGAMDERVEFVYEDGRLVRRTAYLGDFAAPYSTITHTYEDERIITRHYDDDGTGPPSATDTQFLDAEGRVVRVEIDEDEDEIPEFVTEYAYDEQGRLSTVRFDGGDRARSSIAHYHYDC